MPYAVVEDVPASWERYVVVAAALDPLPAGLLVHVAGPTDEGFRIVEVWASEGAWRAFAATRDRGGVLDPAIPVRRTVRDVRARNMVLGPWPGGEPRTAEGT